MFGIERQSAFVNLLLDLYDAKTDDKLLIRYEDLLAHSPAQFGRFTKFVFPNEDQPEHVGQALKLSSFDRMQNQKIEDSVDPPEGARQVRSGV